MCVCLFVRLFCRLKILSCENTINSTVFTMTPTNDDGDDDGYVTHTHNSECYKMGNFRRIENIAFILVSFWHVGEHITYTQINSISVARIIVASERDRNELMMNQFISVCHFRFSALISIFQLLLCWCWQIKIQWHKIIRVCVRGACACLCLSSSTTIQTSNGEKSERISVWQVQIYLYHHVIIVCAILRFCKWTATAMHTKETNKAAAAAPTITMATTTTMTTPMTAAVITIDTHSSKLIPLFLSASALPVWSIC